MNYAGSIDSSLRMCSACAGVNFYEGIKDFKQFFVDDAEIDALLTAGIFEEENGHQEKGEQIQLLLEQANQIRIDIEERVDASRKDGITLPLTDLAQEFRIERYRITDPCDLSGATN